MTLFATHSRAWGGESTSTFLSSSFATDNRPRRSMNLRGVTPITASSSTATDIVVVVGNGEGNKAVRGRNKDRYSDPVLPMDNRENEHEREHVRDVVANNNDGKTGNSATCDDCRVSTSQKKEGKPLLLLSDVPLASAKPLPHQESKPGKTERTIPLEISCHASLSSSVTSEFESGSQIQITAGQQQQEARDSHNKDICLVLLESDWFDDNCAGIKHLVAMANRELVNSSQFMMLDNDRSESSLLSSTLAYSLVCKSNDRRGTKFSERLRSVFPTFLCDLRTGRHDDDDDASETDSESSASASTSLSSFRCGSQDDKKDNSCYQDRTSLKLPALRVLVSSLELVLRTRTTTKPVASDLSRHSSSLHHLSPSFPSIDLLDDFWRSMLTYMTDCLQELVVETGNNNSTLPSAEKSKPSTATRENGSITTPCSIEAALVVKGYRLLHRLQPRLMGPYVRYSLLPFVSNAHEFGKQRQGTRRSAGDKMLVRECERLLKSL